MAEGDEAEGRACCNGDRLNGWFGRACWKNCCAAAASPALAGAARKECCGVWRATPFGGQSSRLMRASGPRQRRTNLSRWTGLRTGKVVLRGAHAVSRATLCSTHALRAPAELRGLPCRSLRVAVAGWRGRRKRHRRERRAWAQARRRLGRGRVCYSFASVFAVPLLAQRVRV